MLLTKTIVFLFFQLHISFNDVATSTYEYPSEQSLLDEMPPEPGDFDYPVPMMQKLAATVGGDSNATTEELNPSAGAKLTSTPGLGTGGRMIRERPKYKPRSIYFY